MVRSQCEKERERMREGSVEKLTKMNLRTSDSAEKRGEICPV